jgi:hypothetical protein
VVIMMRTRLHRLTTIGLVVGLLVQQAEVGRAGVIESFLEHFKGDENEPLTLKQAAFLVDCIDKELFKTGTIGIKAPDVWGQNRMT